MSSAPPPAFLEAVALFNAGRFFECHEVLEDDLWRPLPPGDEKNFYQGVLQIAVGLHHLQQENFTGARHLLERGISHLSPLQGKPPFCHWLDLAQFVTEAEGVRTVLNLSQKGFPGSLILSLKID